MNGSSKHALKVFLPHQCISHSSGLLLGYQDTLKKLCCITNIIPASDDPTISRISANGQLSVVGAWENSVDGGGSVNWNATGESDGGWVFLRKTDGDLPSCELGKSWKHEPCSVIVILYDVTHLARSEYLLERSSSEGGTCVSSNLTFLASSYKRSHRYLVEHASPQVEDFIPGNGGFCQRLDTWLHSLLLSMLAGCCGMLLSVFQTRVFNNEVGRFLGALPATLLQLRKKCCDLAGLRPLPGDPPSLRSRSRLWTHVLDSCLGLALMYWLLQDNTTQYLGQAVIMWAHNVVTELQQLLQWLMGVPAGLKLNSQLDRFLGKFFLYHVYLWTGYLQFLGPILSDLLWYISLTGCLGVSVQLSLLQDLISMMTLHIYCFYVYAARLYSLQLHCLSSLWRLFRGKKWNVLRKRVDSASFDVDQLFIGTLLFTVLLFLLPTVALYYVVFMGLRVVVLSIQGVLYQVVSMLHSVPVYALYLWVFSSQTVNDDVQFHVLKRTPQANRPLYLSLQLMPASLSKLWADFGQIDTGVKYTWSVFAHKLMVGHLVYPWIEAAESKQKYD